MRSGWADDERACAASATSDAGDSRRALTPGRSQGDAALGDRPQSRACRQRHDAALRRAFVLHRYDWSESSLILELFTRHHGRVAVVAKGAKRPNSISAPVLLPLQPLQVAFGGDAEIAPRCRTRAPNGSAAQPMPTGEALLSGYYLNELLLRCWRATIAHPRAVRCLCATLRVLAPRRARRCSRRCARSSCCCCARSACCRSTCTP